MTHQTRILPQTSRPEILDFEVTPERVEPCGRIVNATWEVFDAQTAVIVARGGAVDREAATLAALAVIADRKPSWRFVVRRAHGAPLARVAGMWAPLPLTNAADAAHVYAYVNALPGTAGRPVEVIDLETLK